MCERPAACRLLHGPGREEREASICADANTDPLTEKVPKAGGGGGGPHSS